MARLLVLFAALGCAGPARIPEPLPATPGVPLSSWQAPEHGCRASWLEPATLCAGPREMRFDGCHWHCAPRSSVRISTPGDAPVWRPGR